MTVPRRPLRRLPPAPAPEPVVSLDDATGMLSELGAERGPVIPVSFSRAFVDFTIDRFGERRRLQVTLTPDGWQATESAVAEIRDALEAGR